METEETLSVRLLGDLEVRRGVEKVALPQSRKTRALLAYLLLTRRSHRRTRLCGLLWDVTDDPRGALRWSLSKIRPIVDAGRRRLVAEREGVAIDAADVSVDAFQVERAVASGLEDVSVEGLEALVELHRGELLEGLDLADFEEYQAWCIAEREQALSRHVRVLEALLGRLRHDPARSLPHARALARADSMAPAAHARVLEDLWALGRVEEAALHHRAATRQLEALAPERARQLDGAFAAIRARKVEAPPIRVESPAVEAPAQVLPSRAVPVASAFVARQRELRVARAALAAAASGRLRVLLLVGEPGIGKSRLLDKILLEAKERGALVARGRSWEVETGRPYAPFHELLRGVASALTDASIDDATWSFLEGAADASRRGAVEAAREKAFASVVSVLRAAAEDRPLVLGLDDVQWCDEASSMLLHVVARSLVDRPALIVLAARAGELVDNTPVMRATRSLRREVGVDRLSLERFDEGQTTELLAALDSSLDAAAVHASSGGNPLYAIELARAGDVAGALPESLAELVRDRIDRLSPEAREVLAFGAVLGRHFDVEWMVELARVEQGELAAALEELERHALLASVEADRPSYAFAHDAVRGVVYADVSDPRRKLMHRRVAELLAPRAADGEEEAALVAHHAQLGGAPELAARACVDAGRRAAASLAGATAEAFVRRGMRCASGLPERTRVPILVELYQVHLSAGRPRDRDDVARALGELAERALVLGDVEHARLGYQLLGYLRWEVGDVPDAAKHILEAEWVTRGAEGPERMRALAEAGRCLALLERNLPEADGYLLEASALAKQLLAEPASLVDARALLSCHRGDSAAAMEGFERAKLLARREGDRTVEVQVIEHEVMCAVDAGLLDRAEGRAEELAVLAEHVRGGSDLPAANALLALVRHLRAPDASLAARIDELRRADSKRRLAFVLNRAALAELARGELGRAAELAREASAAASVLDRPSEMAIAEAVGVEVARARGDEREGEAHRASLRSLLDARLSAVATAHALRALGSGDDALPSAAARSPGG